MLVFFFPQKPKGPPDKKNPSSVGAEAHRNRGIRQIVPKRSDWIPVELRCLQVTSVSGGGFHNVTFLLTCEMYRTYLCPYSCHTRTPNQKVFYLFDNFALPKKCTGDSRSGMRTCRSRKKNTATSHHVVNSLKAEQTYWGGAFMPSPWDGTASHPPLYALRYVLTLLWTTNLHPQGVCGFWCFLYCVFLGSWHTVTPAPHTQELWCSLSACRYAFGY